MNSKQLTAVYDFCTENSINMEIYSRRCKEKIRKSHVDVGAFEKNKGPEEWKETYFIYSALLNDVDIFGCSDSFVINDYYLSDKIGFDRKGVEYFLPWYVDSIDLKQNVAIIKDYVDINHVEKGISLIKMWPSNYYHFTIEVLGRLCYVELNNMYTDYPILIDEEVLGDKKNYELIKMIDSHDRKIIPISIGKTYTVDKMVYLSFVSWGSQTPEFLKSGGATAIDPKATKFIRERVLANIKCICKGDKIYVARGNNDRLVNEDAVVRILTKYGFKVLNPDNVSLEEEISHFANAKVIVGVSGAAFTNIIYAHPDVRAYQICPIELQYVSGLYCKLAENVGVNLLNIGADIVSYGINMNKSKFSVNIDHMMEVLEVD